MLQKSARLILAFMLSLSLCPAIAFADEVDEASDAAPSNQMGTQVDGVPVITGVDAASGSRTVTVAGQGFGATQGAGTVQVYTGGIAGGSPITSSVASWTDTQIGVTLGADPTSIIDVVVTTTGGSVRYTKFVFAGSDLYEESLVQPADIYPSGYDGAMASSGILKGWGEYLYYMRETPITAGSATFVYDTLERYGVKTGEWEALPSLSASLGFRMTYCSGAIWDKNLIVIGAVIDEASGVATTTEKVCMYDFDRSAWEELDVTDVPLGAGIVNLNGFLMLVGGATSSWAFTNDVYEFDTGSGVGTRVAKLPTPAFCPQLAVHDGNIFVYSYGDTIAQYNGSGSRHFQVVVGEDVVKLDGALPTFSAPDVAPGMPARAEEFGSLVAVIEGLMLIGPGSVSELNVPADTYILDWEFEKSAFVPYHLLASDAPIYGAAACIHDNMLYVAASSRVEPKHSVFRATEMIAPMVESGNNQVWRRGSNKVLTIVFTPDFSRYYDRVYVDGVELYGDTEYNATPGSTVIDLVPSFLQTLAVGEHDVLVYFDGYEDGPGAEAIAHFIIKDGSSSDDPDEPVEPEKENPSVIESGKSGYTRPAALAMTGDLMLVVPFAVLGVGAVALGIYLVRRKIRNR